MGSKSSLFSSRTNWLLCDTLSASSVDISARESLQEREVPRILVVPSSIEDSTDWLLLYDTLFFSSIDMSSRESLQERERSKFSILSSSPVEDIAGSKLDCVPLISSISTSTFLESSRGSGPTSSQQSCLFVSFSIDHASDWILDDSWSASSGTFSPWSSAEEVLKQCWWLSAFSSIWWIVFSNKTLSIGIGHPKAPELWSISELLFSSSSMWSTVNWSPEDAFLVKASPWPLIDCGA